MRCRGPLRGANRRKRVSEVRVQCLKPFRKLYSRFAATVQHDVSAVYVQNLGRFYSGVIEIFVFRIERMIDLEVLTATASHVEVAFYFDIAHGIRPLILWLRPSRPYRRLPVPQCLRFARAGASASTKQRAITAISGAAVPSFRTYSSAAVADNAGSVGDNTAFG